MTPEHADVVNAMTSLVLRGEDLVTTAQTLIEFWVVATRPSAVNGFGWTPSQAHGALAGFVRQGKRAHDARLAAVMLAHGVTTVLTLGDGGHRLVRRRPCLDDLLGQLNGTRTLECVNQFIRQHRGNHHLPL